VRPAVEGEGKNILTGPEERKVFLAPSSWALERQGGRAPAIYRLSSPVEREKGRNFIAAAVKKGELIPLGRR